MVAVENVAAGLKLTHNKPAILLANKAAKLEQLA